jgi:transposase
MSYLLTPTQHAALAPHLRHTSPAGRPLRDPRARLETLLHHAASGRPWREAAACPREAATLSQHYRRLTHAGVWERLLTALAEAPPGHPLRTLETLLCRAARRAYRIRGLALILLARRLKLRRALPGPPWLLPDPDLSETLAQPGIVAPRRPPRGQVTLWRGQCRALRRLLRWSLGRRSIPRSVRFAWP